MNSPKSVSGAKLAIVAGLLGGASLSSIAHADAIQEMISGGKATLDVRARYEYVDGQGGARDVNGYSLRTRLGFTTAAYEGFKAMIELEDLSFIDNNNRPGLDVPTTEINQSWVSYANEDFSVKVGNQVYTLDDHRFIGHVGWRQNIQSFDAVTSTFTVSGDIKLNAAYLAKVNRVNATAQKLDGFLLNGSYKVSEELNLTGFLYNLEFDNWAPQSTTTAGLRATGVFGGEQKFNYVVSYANQQDAGINPGDIDTDYYLGELSTTVAGVKLTAGLEGLGDSFTTPLATVHKFAGFADAFAGASINGMSHGLNDLYLTASYKLPLGKGLPLNLTYHDFSSATGGVDLGTEIDAVATYKYNEYTTLIAKYAYYDADSSNSLSYGRADASVFTFESNFSF